VSLGCSPSAKPKQFGCSANRSELTMDFGGYRVVFDDACTYEVAKHVGDTTCSANDITINMTATVVAPPESTKVKVGLVYTVASPDVKGRFTKDPTQLCSTGGYYATTGDWTSKYDTVTTVPWPTADQLDELVPSLEQDVDLKVLVLNSQAHGRLALLVSATK
jgi:hypothetical protein